MFAQKEKTLKTQCFQGFSLEEPNGLDATSETLILSGFSECHLFRS